MTLESFFKENPHIALAFSGGTDSSFLLYEGLRCHADIQAYYIKTQFQPQFELDDAVRLSDELNAHLKIIELDVLAEASVSSNPIDRCYHCKTALFTALLKRAKADGYDVVVDGTNASDNVSERPGMKALHELGVRSPLRECGLTKDDIRRLSKNAGLFTWDKPAYACLATRVPAGTEITPPLLRRVEGAENALFALGFSDFRVRVFNGAARLQFPAQQAETVFKNMDDIKNAIEPFFSPVLLDLNWR